VMGNRRMVASRHAQATAPSEAADPSTPTKIPYLPVAADISHTMLWTLKVGCWCWRLADGIGQRDVQMEN